MEDMYVTLLRFCVVAKDCPSLVAEDSLRILESIPSQQALTKAALCLLQRPALECVVLPPRQR